MARKYVTWDEGTPQRELEDAVARAYPGRAEAFFEAAAAKLSVKPDSASGTYYGFLAGKRRLPDQHRVAYRELLGVNDETLDRISESGGRPAAPRRGRLEELAREVADLTAALAVAQTAHEQLAERVEALERGRRAARAKPRGLPE